MEQTTTNNSIKTNRIRKRVLIAILSVLLAGVIAFLPFIPRTIAFWGSEIQSEPSLFSTIVRIGSWDTREGVIVNFDDAVAVLTEQDPLIQNGTRRIHILGDADTQALPNRPVSVNQYDIFMFKTDGVIIAVTATGSVSLSIFDSWQAFDQAISLSSIPFSNQATVFNPLSTYTRSHAPILHNGRRYLARHDSVTSTPSIGNDWFRVTPFWVNQSYPIGSLVTHMGAHFRKISTLDAEPGTNSAIWQEIPFVDRSIFDTPIWYQRAWNLHSVVLHHGVFHVSLIQNNTASPANPLYWQEIIPHDPAATVPNWTFGTSYQVGDFVKSIVGSEERFFTLVHAWGATFNPVTNPAAWTEVFNFDGLTTVQPWSPTTTYDGEWAGRLVEYQGFIFQVTGHSGIGITPLQAPDHFRRILTWEETQRPIPLSGPLSGVHTATRLFEVLHRPNPGYFALVINAWAGYNPTNFDTSPRFRRVERFDPNQTYHQVGHNTWNTALRYHAYTIDEETNEKIFWEAFNAPSSGITGYAPSDESPHWRRFVFDASGEELIITTVNNRPVVWERNFAPGVIPSQPSILNPEWTRRIFPVDNDYVYTIYNGARTLWRRNGTGSTNEIPGAGSDWTHIPFRTGIPFVYTVNSVGIHMFWHSPSQSNTHPALGNLYWNLLGEALHTSVPDFFYMISDGEVFYFEQSAYGPWMRHRNAWHGKVGTQMVNYWYRHNFYNSGDIVVYGTTLHNLNRFFRMREGVNARLAVGISPMSNAGMAFWEAI
ncbi:MAG: hypothetical protein FWE22_06755 [Firmicutes bacterium]|nr:hypothetical protein [Bacillota bacterium]